jgi:hypothetical protein
VGKECGRIKVLVASSGPSRDRIRALFRHGDATLVGVDSAKSEHGEAEQTQPPGTESVILGSKPRSLSLLLANYDFAGRLRELVSVVLLLCVGRRGHGRLRSVFPRTPMPSHHDVHPHIQPTYILPCPLYHAALVSSLSFFCPSIQACLPFRSVSASCSPKMSSPSRRGKL